MVNFLLGTFINTELSGTKGGSFQTVYTQFLRETSAFAGEQKLLKVAELTEESGRDWSEIAL